MSAHSDLYQGVSRIAWSYLFSLLNINLGTLNILPNWVAFVLLYGAVNLLADQEPELLLLKPFCILLGTWAAVQWVGQIFGWSPSFYPLDLIIQVISLYFYFQLLTNLAHLAARYGGEALSGRILRLRTAQILLDTFTAVYLYVASGRTGISIPGEALGLSLGILLVAGLILMISIMSALFKLRGCFQGADLPDEAP